jgi:hypothetical protein
VTACTGCRVDTKWKQLMACCWLPSLALQLHSGVVLHSLFAGSMLATAQRMPGCVPD